MGWGRYFFLDNVGQQLDIEEQRKAMDVMRRSASQRATEAWEVRLYLTALIRYLIGKKLIDQEEFRKLIDEVDREDGFQDGASTGPIT